MHPLIVLSIQATLSLIVFTLIALHYVLHRLMRLSLDAALLPLLLIHTFRYAPLTLFVPGHVPPGIPADAAATIAYGDLFSGILALIAAILLVRKIQGAVFVTLVFNLVGMLDIVNALRVAIQASLYEFLPGVNWYIITLYVPLLVVTHVLMIYLIAVRRNRST